MSKHSSQQLRIIGGQWRSRRLDFPNLDGLRPTLDRVRETVFNWLQFDVAGKEVLDLFAGSGALGLEALSRGAKHATFIEKHPTAAKQLTQNLTSLKATNANVVQADAIQWCAANPSTAQLVFIDPPFHLNLLQPILNNLQLNVGCLIYVEHEPEVRPVWPTNWQERKCKQTKEFVFRLFEVIV